MHNRVPVTYSMSAEHVRGFPEPINNFDLTSLQMTNRKFLVWFFWHLDHYTLNVYRSDEYVTYLC